MLVPVESGNVGACKHSSSSRVDDLVHERFVRLVAATPGLLKAAEPPS